MLTILGNRTQADCVGVGDACDCATTAQNFFLLRSFQNHSLFEDYILYIKSLYIIF